jgi:diketogulonate reductase-like aldo/keto reductase
MAVDTPTRAIGSRLVHPIGIGTWLIEDPDDERQIEAIRYSLSLGQNHIDTAEMYGSGRTKTTVGRALQGVPRDSVFLASKLWRNSCSKDGARPAVEAMLERLQVSQLDLLYIHSTWSGLDIPEAVEAMCVLVDAGLVQALGLSNFNLQELRAAMQITRIPFVALQNRYNVLFKSEAPKELLEFCRNNDITMVAYQPVERGLVLKDATIQRVAEAHGATRGQVAIAWLIRQPGVVTIPKAVSRAHIDENLGALNLTLTEDEADELNVIPQTLRSNLQRS